MTEQTKADYIGELDVDASTWDEHPSEAAVEETVANLESNGFAVEVVPDAEAALGFLKGAIPAGASVMIGHSTTLEEVGFVAYLNGDEHDWENRYGEVFAIDDDEERARARREALTADYFLGGANAVAQTGAVVAADLSGSRVGAYPFAAGNLLVVAGVNKVVPDEAAARERLHEFAYRFEDARAKDAYGAPSDAAKELVYRREPIEGRTTVVLVEETLGF